jgi:hypothetical protein
MAKTTSKVLFKGNVDLAPTFSKATPVEFILLG